MTVSGEKSCSGCNVAGVALVVVKTGLLLVSRDRRVGRLGVDFDWKPAGIGSGFGGVPLLCGGIVFYALHLCQSCLRDGVSKSEDALGRASLQLPNQVICANAGTSLGPKP